MDVEECLTTVGGGDHHHDRDGDGDGAIGEESSSESQQ